MRLDIISLFPGVFEAVFSESIIGRARKRHLVEVRLVNLRDFAHDKRGTVDDSPYGGGAGMVLKPEPLFEAIESLRTPQAYVVLTSPQGRPFTQGLARELVQQEHLILICGHYEGVDERVREALVDAEISIGDYVLTNGMLPAMVMADAIIRLLPGVLGCPESLREESFAEGLLEYPHYTRPEEYRGRRVPDVLLSGNHQAIARWRSQQALARTRERRPDLLTDNNSQNGEFRQ